MMILAELLEKEELREKTKKVHRRSEVGYA